MFPKPKLGKPTPVSFEDMQKFNDYMKEVVRDYKIRQAKSIEIARNVIINK